MIGLTFIYTRNPVSAYAFSQIQHRLVPCIYKVGNAAQIVKQTNTHMIHLRTFHRRTTDFCCLRKERSFT